MPLEGKFCYGQTYVRDSAQRQRRWPRLCTSSFPQDHNISSSVMKNADWKGAPEMTPPSNTPILNVPLSAS